MGSPDFLENQNCNTRNFSTFFQSNRSSQTEAFGWHLDEKNWISFYRYVRVCKRKIVIFWYRLPYLSDHVDSIQESYSVFVKPRSTHLKKTYNGDLSVRIEVCSSGEGWLWISRQVEIIYRFCNLRDIRIPMHAAEYPNNKILMQNSYPILNKSRRSLLVENFQGDFDEKIKVCSFGEFWVW